MSGKRPGSLARAKAALESDLLGTSLELRRASEEYASLEAAFRLAAERLREASETTAALRDEGEGVRRAATALKADRDELRRLTASLREELAAARAETAGVRAELARTQREKDDANARLAEVRATRAWRLANLYWRILRRLGLLPAGVEPPGVPAPLPEPPSPVSAPDAHAPADPAPVAFVEDDPIPAPRAIPGPPAPVEPPPRTFGSLRDPNVPGLPDIVCFSIVEWEFLFQRPQQLLSRLADRGHRVWYVSQFFEPSPGAPSAHRLRSRVSTLRLRGSARHLFSEELPADEADAVFASLSSLRDAEGIASAVSFVHQPFWWPLAERARRAFGWKVLYDCMDDHGGFQTNARPVDGPERGILEDADAVVTTARALEERLRSAGRAVELVPNGCDFEYFASIAPRARGGRPTVGYYGCIADWFDSDLVADVAGKRPDWDFVLIGPTYLADLTRLPALPNVTFPGLVPYGQLLERIERFDVFLLPFRRSPLTDAANPVKAYEIMATGRPLVSVPLPELEPFGGLVRFAGDAAELERKIEDALAEDDPGLEARRRDFARRNSWDARAEVLARIVGALGVAAPAVVDRSGESGAAVVAETGGAAEAGVASLRRELADRIRASGIDPSRVVVFLPTIGWEIVLVQRPHHMARALARRGFFVLFDCSNSPADTFSGFREVEENLLLFKGPFEALTSLTSPILWTLPYNAGLAERWPARRLVYDCIDDLAVFPHDPEVLRRAHEKMLLEAEAVLCVSRPLLEGVQPDRPDALYVPNAVDPGHFAGATRDGPPPEALRPALASGLPIAGYYGAIASWLDVGLVEGAAKLRPDWTFVLIGQKLEDAPSLEPLVRLPNVHVLPAQRYETIPSFLVHFDVAFIPFVVNDVTRATSPLKLFEYFAGGRPVVSSPMPECAAFPEVRIVRDARELAAALDLALVDSRDEGYGERLRRIAAGNSWDARAGTVIAVLDTA